MEITPATALTRIGSHGSYGTRRERSAGYSGMLAMLANNVAACPVRAGLSQYPGAAMEGSKVVSMIDDKRMCRIGDTISTVSDVAGPGLYLNCSIATQYTCDYAKLLITSGRWRVSRCGQCGLSVEECDCDLSQS